MIIVFQVMFWASLLMTLFSYWAFWTRDISDTLIIHPAECTTATALCGMLWYWS